MSNVNRLSVCKDGFIKLSDFLWMITMVMRIIKDFLDQVFDEKIGRGNFVAGKKKVFCKSEEIIVFRRFCGWFCDNGFVW